MNSNDAQYVVPEPPMDITDFQNLGDDNDDDFDGGGQGNGDESTDNYVPKNEFVKLEQQYKSLQGQFKKFNPEAMSAQIEFLKSMVVQSQAQRQPEPVAAPQLPKISEKLRTLFGQDADEFEQVVNGPTRLVFEQQKQIEQLTQALQHLNGQVAKTPYDVMRATDNTYSMPEFQEFLENERDVFGEPLAESIKLRNAQGYEQGMKAMAAAKALFLKKNAPQQQATQQRPVPNTIPQFNQPSANGGSQQPVGRKAQELISQFKKLQTRNITSTDLDRRLEILGELARLGVDTREL